MKSIALALNSSILILRLKGELRKFQIYFRKIPLHQQKFLVISVLSNSPWLLNNFKKRLK